MSRFIRIVASIAGLLLLAGFWAGAFAQTVTQSGKSDQSTAEESAEQGDGTAIKESREYIPPEELVQKAFEAPAEAKRLTKDSSLWIDRKRQRVYLDGYVALQKGVLEMFACPAGTKEHESVVATLAKASQVHAALLAINATPGTPVRHLPRYVPATGQVIRIWVCWLDKKGKFNVADARTWVKRVNTNKEMSAEWVFAGSKFWVDESNGREYYQADAGDMICVSNFTSAMIDVNISSSADADELRYVSFEERVPEMGTPVRLILAPIPNPTDKPNEKPKFDPNDPPTEEVLKKKAPADPKRGASPAGQP